MSFALAPTAFTSLRRPLAALFLMGLVAPSGPAWSADPPALRPPSAPLVTHDPYFSIWSPHDRLNDGDTQHWTGAPHRLTVMVRIDGEAFRLMGGEPADVPPLPQSALQVTPTQTWYSFDHSKLNLSLGFVTPALPDDLDLLSRPLTYVVFKAQGKGEAHPEVQLYLDARAEIAVNTHDQVVRVEAVENDVLRIVRAGTVEQAVLNKQGDDLRIDWGYLYLAAPKQDTAAAVVASGDAARSSFRTTGKLPAGTKSSENPAKEADVLAVSWDLGKLGEETVQAVNLIAYDDEFSIRYFDTDLRPYWRRNGADALKLLTSAAPAFESLLKRCDAFDRELLADAEKTGGPNFARIVALCHRQSLAATKLVADAKGQPLYMSKENNSNGCIATVDVMYPQAPQLLLLSPALMKATVVPILDYAASPRWKFDFAPHDLGRYPHATGQVYGGGERTLDRQMMVEESANMLLLVAAIAKVDGHADFALPYWPLLRKWAAYLEQHGYDPENQLCTDDFAGHLARNVNLSAKAIVALGAFGQLANTAKKPEDAKYLGIAKDMAARWVQDADDGGTHTRLGFGLPDTWSQKYNVVWDRVLGLSLFPRDAIDRELAYYRTQSNTYGLPLDSRQPYTKLDWILWTATLATNREDFDFFVDPVLKFINETPDRTPLTDWYFTDSGQRKGFKARSVVGGVFMPLLTDEALWKKWAERGADAKGPWAPIKLRPVTVLAPTGEDVPAVWRVNPRKPQAARWNQPGFQTGNQWKETEFPVGVQSDAGVPIRTKWEQQDLWAVRRFTLPKDPAGEIRIRVAHSSPFELWINGKPAISRTSPVRGYQTFRVSEEAAKSLKGGENTLAIHTRTNNMKPQFRDVIDVGLISLGE